MQHVINAMTNCWWHVTLFCSSHFQLSSGLGVNSPDSISCLAVQPSMPSTSSSYIVAPAHPLPISPVSQSLAAWAGGHPDFADLWVPPPFLVSGHAGMEQKKADCEHSAHAIQVCYGDVVILIGVSPPFYSSLCHPFRQPWPQLMTTTDNDWWLTDDNQLAKDNNRLTTDDDKLMIDDWPMMGDDRLMKD